jgi:hypothetical protein
MKRIRLSIMKKSAILFPLLLLAGSSHFYSLHGQPAGVEAAGNSSFRPGKMWPDEKGASINAHGGGILFHNGVYY